MPYFLDFEKPIADLEDKIEELRHLSDGEINIADEVGKLEEKVDRQLRQTYGHLSAWQKVQVARHPGRPKCGDYVDALIEDFVPFLTYAHTCDELFEEVVGVFLIACAVNLYRRPGLAQPTPA